MVGCATLRQGEVVTLVCLCTRGWQLGQGKYAEILGRMRVSMRHEQEGERHRFLVMQEL